MAGFHFQRDRVHIRNAERYDLVKIKPTPGELLADPDSAYDPVTHSFKQKPKNKPIASRHYVWSVLLLQLLTLTI